MNNITKTFDLSFVHQFMTTNVPYDYHMCPYDTPNTDIWIWLDVKVQLISWWSSEPYPTSLNIWTHTQAGPVVQIGVLIKQVQVQLPETSKDSECCREILKLILCRLPIWAHQATCNNTPWTFMKKTNGQQKALGLVPPAVFIYLFFSLFNEKLQIWRYYILMYIYIIRFIG